MRDTHNNNMTSGHVFIATSLDGYIARPNGDIDWLEVRDPRTQSPAEKEDYGYAVFMERMDGMIMGRGTFEKVLAFDTWMYSKPVIVLSRSLTERDIPAALVGKVRVSNLSPLEISRQQFEAGWRHVYVDGGKVIQSFLRDGLIADLVITQIPVLLGEGLPLFGALESDVSLRHIETATFSPGFVQSKYEVEG